MNYILSIDQGTSSTKTLIFNEEGKAIAKGSEPLKSYFSERGFVEQDPEEIYPISFHWLSVHFVCLFRHSGIISR